MPVRETDHSPYYKEAPLFSPNHHKDFTASLRNRLFFFPLELMKICHMLIRG